jgi:hypothetical protein
MLKLNYILVSSYNDIRLKVKLHSTYVPTLHWNKFLNIFSITSLFNKFTSNGASIKYNNVTFNLGQLMTWTWSNLDIKDASEVMKFISLMDV